MNWVKPTTTQTEPKMDGKGTEAAYKLNRIELSCEWIKIELHYNLNARRGVGGVEVDRQAPAHQSEERIQTKEVLTLSGPCPGESFCRYC